MKPIARLQNAGFRKVQSSNNDSDCVIQKVFFTKLVRVWAPMVMVACAFNTSEPLTTSGYDSITHALLDNDLIIFTSYGYGKAVN